MSVVDLTACDNPDLLSNATPEEVFDQLNKLCGQLRQMIPLAAQNGESFDDTERDVWQTVRKIGHQAMQLFVSLQGEGDLGETVTTEEGKTLRRSVETVTTRIRSIFGEHAFQQYTYGAGKNKRIELRPISARMSLPDGRWSFLLEEFSQLFCVESAFNQSAENLETVLGGKFSVDTLEQTSRKMGEQAGVFLDDLPIPDADSEAKLLVASADCKGVPLVKQDAAKLAAFETAKKRPGNRRMATVTSAYTIEPHFRTAEQVVDALFRNDDKTAKKRRKRPRPRNKNTTAHFPTVFRDGEEETPISGIHEGIAWLAGQIEDRRSARQVLIVLMDGQEALWETMALHVDFGKQTVGILDILHVAVYVWEAAALFCTTRAERESFTKERLLRILRGEVTGVIRGLRRMASQRRLAGQPKKDIHRICGYFEKHADRMRYDEYLSRGYPIASGVIEGACRHLVKDRMERSGMRWTLEGARSMLNVRAVFQSDHWRTFLTRRRDQLVNRAHSNRDLLKDYTPLQLAC